MRRIGIVGGTFNPIHMGHLLLAEWAREEAALDEIWLIPSGISYMKKAQEVASAEDRLRMTELAAEGNEHFRCLDLEVKRDGYTYSYETLEELNRTYPEDEFYFILGADCLFTLEKWKFPERILSCCTLIAAVRDETSLKELSEKKEELERRFGGKILLMSFVRLSLSSTEIRRRVREGRSIRYMTPDNVLSYMEEKGLYR